MIKCRDFASFPLLILLMLAASGCSDPPPALVPGSSVPGFALADLSGGTVKMPEDLAGKVVAVRFWADWCPFCKSEMQALEPVYQRLQDEGLALLAINVRQEPATAKAFVDKLGISYPTLLDRDGAVAREYHVIGLPTTFIVDREGRLVGRIIGESTPEVFENAVRERL
ncbi:MAG: TlpA family protein disulfide reductase [Thiotrichales bacterium]